MPQKVKIMPKEFVIVEQYYKKFYCKAVETILGREPNVKWSEAMQNWNLVWCEINTRL